MNDGLDVHQFSSNYDNIDEIRNNSLNSGEGVVTSSKKVSKKEKHKRMRKIIASVGFVATLGLGAGIKTSFDKLNDFLDLRYLENDFWESYIDPNVHNNQNGTFSYYYGNIAEAISKDGEIKDDVYYMTQCMSAHVDDVLLHTEYGNYETFLSQNGYESEEEFLHDMRRQILAGSFEAEKQSVSR